MSTRREFLAASSSLGAPALDAGRAAPIAPGRKVRLAVVGGGFGTSFQFHEHPNCEVAAVADRRERLRSTYRCDTVFESLEKLLAANLKLDAVAIFTGAPDHYRHVEMCMNRGLHALSAVPAVMSLEEAARPKSPQGAHRTALHDGRNQLLPPGRDLRP